MNNEKIKHELLDKWFVIKEIKLELNSNIVSPTILHMISNECDSQCYFLYSF